MKIHVNVSKEERYRILDRMSKYLNQLPCILQKVFEEEVRNNECICLSNFIFCDEIYEKEGDTFVPEYTSHYKSGLPYILNHLFHWMAFTNHPYSNKHFDSSHFWMSCLTAVRSDECKGVSLYEQGLNMLYYVESHYPDVYIYWKRKYITDKTKLKEGIKNLKRIIDQP